MRQTLKQGLEENSLMRLLVPRERFLSERFVSSLEYHDVLISYLQAMGNKGNKG